MNPGEAIPTTSAPSIPAQRSWLARLLRLSPGPVLRLYHGYGSSGRVLVLGHLLYQAPPPRAHYRNGFFRNSFALLSLFMVKPMAGITVRIRFGDAVAEVISADDGFFSAEIEVSGGLAAGWMPVDAWLPDLPEIRAEGKVYVPPPARLAFVSDIDDTFLISHSSHLAKRLYLLLTRNARTRKPFNGVVEHYQLLAGLFTGPEAPNPFFYVSSSEWNLYDYIKEFCRFHQLPEGVFLLSALKQLSSFWKTGQGKHGGKYFRIARIFVEFKELRFVLLGDDSQQDPEIYTKLVRDFPGRVLAVYLRHRVSAHLKKTRGFEAEMAAAGVEVCYFTHSETAMAHSARFFGDESAVGGMP